ncbi:hypothetical protein [Flavobacterium zhouii]|uniref:hypothetical protein n=1 Tax=Flavobacterium zhoui TaxID=3230414 RepID=UPI0036D43E72
MNYKVNKVLTKLEFMDLKKTIRSYEWFLFFSPDGSDILFLSRFLTRQEKI